MTPQHPFDGLGMTYDDNLKFWDDIAECYMGMTMQGDIPSNVVSDLCAKGWLDGDSEVLELGSGPGTYSLHLAENVHRLTCLDTSDKMISILKKRSEAAGISNIDVLKEDYHTYSGRRYDAVISSLCPGTGSTEALKIMESLSKRYCVHAMWIVNSWDELNEQVWKELGKDFSYGSRRKGIVKENLESMGREPEVYIYNTHVDVERRFEDIIDREKLYFDLMGVDADEALMKVYGKFEEDGMFRYSCDNSLRLVTWEVPGC